MKSDLQILRLAASCMALSLGVHGLILSQLWRFGNIDFARPVVAMIDLSMNTGKTEPLAVKIQGLAHGSLQRKNTVVVPERNAPVSLPQVSEDYRSVISPGSEKQPDHLQGDAGVPVTAVSALSSTADNAKVVDLSSIAAGKMPVIAPPLRASGEFLHTEKENLLYRISMFGAPVGKAELEARNDQGEVRISLRIRSDGVFAGIYPVDDVIETRHVNGNFIITKIKQQEGNFQSNRGFTIFLRDRYIFWINLLNNRSSQEPIPNSEVLDALSGFYYLRNRPLQVGSTEVLHIYDSNRYDVVPVDVLRRETIRLFNLDQVDTLVIRPRQDSDGITRRTGELLIWLTDDANRVPVKVETSIALGGITAELISSEVRRHGDQNATVTALKDEKKPLTHRIP
jgi:hypothetical protein